MILIQLFAVATARKNNKTTECFSPWVFAGLKKAQARAQISCFVVFSNCIYNKMLTKIILSLQLKKKNVYRQYHMISLTLYVL